MAQVVSTAPAPAGTANGTPRTVIVLVPGASCTPSHYAHLLHVLHSKGYATMTDGLASTGQYHQISIEDDAKYVHSNMLLPELEVENHNVVLVTHSYSGIPGGAAAKGLGKKARTAQGKSTSVIGQIHIAALITPGDDGRSIRDLFGGNMPPHIVVDEPANMLRCPDPIPPLFNDVPQDIAETMVAMCQNPCLSSWITPCPPASWMDDEWKGRSAYIRTLQDQCIPFDIQKHLLQESGKEFITKDIDSGHCAQLSQPEKLAEMIVELTQHFESLA